MKIVDINQEVETRTL